MTTPLTPTYQSFDEPELSLIAPILGALVPGLGHAYLGERRRAILIATGILSMFFGGLFIGGVDVVDRQEDFVWFVGEALVGPIAFGVDYYHQHFIKVYDPSIRAYRSAHPFEIAHPVTRVPIIVRDPVTQQPIQFADPVTNQLRVSTDRDRPPNTKSLGRVNEVGTLFCTIAGMLNLICVIDAAYRRKADPKATTGGGRS